MIESQIPPLVSVVMPAWNAADSIEPAIESVRAQTLDAWELIIVDDGSADATAACAERAARRDPRVRVVRTAHGGIVAALQAGLAQARAPWVARMDADDHMMPARLALQAAFLRAHPEVGVVSCLVAFGGDAAAARGYALHVDWINSLRTHAEIACARFIESPVAHPSVMFRRSLLDEHGGYAAGCVPEDYELWLRWLDAGVRFGKVAEVLLRWNDPPRRLSRVDLRYGDDAMYACKCRYLARWLKANVARDREILLWGAGRTTRQRFAALATEGIKIAAYIDVDRRKIGTRVGGVPVLGSEAIPPSSACFVVGGVGVRGARELHRATLQARGFREGVDFIFAA